MPGRVFRLALAHRSHHQTAGARRAPHDHQTTLHTPPRFRLSRFHGVQQVLNCFCIRVYRVTRENVDHPDERCSVASLHRLQRMKLESPSQHEAKQPQVGRHGSSFAWLGSSTEKLWPPTSPNIVPSTKRAPSRRLGERCILPSLETQVCPTNCRACASTLQVFW